MFNSRSTALLAQALNPRSRVGTSGGGMLPPGGGEPPEPPDNVIHHWFGQPERPSPGPPSFQERGNVVPLPERPGAFNWQNWPDKLPLPDVANADPRNLPANEPMGPDASISHMTPPDEGPFEPLGNQATIRPLGPQDAMLPRGSVVPGNQSIDWDTVPMPSGQIGGPPGLMLPWVQTYGGNEPPHMWGINPQPPMDQGGGLKGAEIPSTSDGTAGAEVRDSGGGDWMFNQPAQPQGPSFADFGGMGLPGGGMDFGGGMPNQSAGGGGDWMSPMQPSPMDYMDFFGGGGGGGGITPGGLLQLLMD